MRHHRRDGALLTSGVLGPPQLLRQNAHEVFAHTAAMVECLQQFPSRIQRLTRGHDSRSLRPTKLITRCRPIPVLEPATRLPSNRSAAHLTQAHWMTGVGYRLL